MRRTDLMEKVRHIDEVVHRATDACRTDASVAPEVRRSLESLGAETLQLRQLLQTEAEPQRILQHVDALEALGDRAKHACEQFGVMRADLRSAVVQAHSELSNLKHKLH